MQINIFVFQVEVEGGGHHSVFACPILRQQGSEQNPPMRLLCGHVISQDALNKLCQGIRLYVLFFIFFFHV